jgi:[ribosomal protein S5]-alanine N-acetyltransferase
MKIELGDIYLRFVEPDDAVVALAYLERNREFFRPFDPYRPPEHFSEGGQRTLLEASAKRRMEGDEYPFGIFLSADDSLIGRVTLSNIVRRAFQNAYIGYSLDRDHNGRGFMTAAVSATVDYAFGPGELHRVQAAVMPDNVASIRVVEKAGFRKEGFAPNYLRINGRWRDHNLYATTVEDRGTPTGRFR